MRIRLVAIVGPTAVGKTALSLRLAEHFGGEIIGADSRQFYRGMDIGTAKPTVEERARVRHHLIDLVAPNEVLTLGQYRALAYHHIEDIAGRGRLPIIVGGTGLYLKTVVEGWTIPEVEPNQLLRAQLEQEVREHGPHALHERLQAVDPAGAAKVDPRNVRRVIRYLEVAASAGGPISARQGKSPPPYDILQIGLTLPRETLYRRIDERVDAMLAAGLLTEVQALVAAGYGTELPSMSGFGYKQLAQHLAGDMTLTQAIAETKKETRRFVRRQYAWYRLDDPNIMWLQANGHAFERARNAVTAFLGVTAQPSAAGLTHG